MDDTEEELPAGFHVTDGTDDVEAVEAVEDEVLPEDTYATDPNTALFDTAFGGGQTVFPEGEDGAEEFLAVISEAHGYEDR
jgi:hypothetical protein